MLACHISSNSRLHGDLAAIPRLHDVYWLGFQGRFAAQTRQDCRKAGMRWMLLLQHRPAFSNQTGGSMFLLASHWQAVWHWCSLWAVQHTWHPQAQQQLQTCNTSSSTSILWQLT